MPPTDHLTALRTTTGAPATKRHTYVDGEWETIAYNAGTHFEWAQASVSGVEELSTRLRELEPQSRWFVIRGEPRRRIKYLPRTYHREKGDPGFRPCDRKWLCVDVDGLASPGELDGESAARRAIAALPDYFHDVTVHWQLSSSAGISSTREINLHLWYWLDRPVCSFSLREWAKELREAGRTFVDAMLYNPVQPHFTANPIIEGREDPIPERSGLLHLQEDELTLPQEVTDLDTWTATKQKEEEERWRQRKSASASRRPDPRSGEIRRRYVLSALYDACHRIESAPRGDRHRTIYAQAAAVGGLLHTGLLSKSRAQRELEQSALLALSGEGRQREAVRCVEEALQKGQGDPRDISHVGPLQESGGVDQGSDDGWLSSHEPITCEKFERTSTGCRHYLEWGGCALAEEFMCTEWLKVNPVSQRIGSDQQPPRKHWTGQ